MVGPESYITDRIIRSRTANKDGLVRGAWAEQAHGYLPDPSNSANGGRGTGGFPSMLRSPQSPQGHAADLIGCSAVDPAAEDLAVVGEERDEAMLQIGIGQPGRPADLVSLDVVRPDDNAFTQPLLDVGDQPGEGIGSEASSEVVPVAADLLVDVAPGGSAQGAGINLRHRSSLSRSARRRSASPDPTPRSSSDAAAPSPR